MCGTPSGAGLLCCPYATNLLIYLWSSTIAASLPIDLLSCRPALVHLELLCSRVVPFLLLYRRFAPVPIDLLSSRSTRLALIHMDPLMTPDPLFQSSQFLAIQVLRDNWKQFGRFSIKPKKTTSADGSISRIKLYHVRRNQVSSLIWLERYISQLSVEFYDSRFQVFQKEL